MVEKEDQVFCPRIQVDVELLAIRFSVPTIAVSNEIRILVLPFKIEERGTVVDPREVELVAPASVQSQRLPHPLRTRTDRTRRRCATG